MPLGLVEQDLTGQTGVLPACNLQSTRLVFLLLLHVDCLLRFARFDLVFLCLFELLFILQFLCMFQVHVIDLVLSIHVGHGLGFFEVFQVDQLVNRWFGHTKFHQEFYAFFLAHWFGPPFHKIINLLGTAVILDHAQWLVPEWIGFIHLHCVHPHAAVNLALLGLELVAVLLLDRCNLHLHVLEQVRPELLRQFYHVLPFVCIALHRDCLVNFFHFQLELFCFFITFFIFEFLRIFTLQWDNFAFRQVPGSKFVGIVILFMVDLHFECFVKTLGFMEQLFGLCKLFGLSLEFGNLLDLGPWHLTGLVGEQVQCNLPLARGDGSLDSLPRSTRINLVRHRRLCLLQGHQVVTPLFFQLAYVTREWLFGQVNCFFERISFGVLLQCFVEYV